MKTITKKSLDEMARTMSVIPTSKLSDFAGGTYIEYSSLYGVANFYSSYFAGSSQWREAVIYMYSDGTYGVYFDENFEKTHFNKDGTPADPAHAGEILYDTYSGSSAIYFSGKQVIGVAHTHQYGSEPSTSGVVDSGDVNNKIPGIPNYVYYNYTLYSF